MTKLITKERRVSGCTSDRSLSPALGSCFFPGYGVLRNIQHAYFQVATGFYSCRFRAITFLYGQGSV